MTTNPEAELGRITRIDAREVWRHEAHRFTPWLYEHIDQLNEVIGFEIELTGRETPVGPFAVDLYGREVQTDAPAIIENQLAPTDHSHLGQLITYAASLKAGVIVWVAADFREEHREALDWLNEISPEEVNFFGVKLEVIEINGQRAPLFRAVAQPNTWQKARSRGRSSVEPGERNLRYQSFFTNVLERFKQEHPGLTTASTVRPKSSLRFSAGKSKLSYRWSFTHDRRFRVALHMGMSDVGEVDRLFNGLLAKREALQAEIGAELAWEPLEGYQASRVSLYADFEGSIDSDEGELDDLEDWAVDAMGRFVTAIAPRIQAIA